MVDSEAKKCGMYFESHVRSLEGSLNPRPRVQTHNVDPRFSQLAARFVAEVLDFGARALDFGAWVCDPPDEHLV